MITQEYWNFNDFSHEALVRRASYLVDVIDQIPNKATYADIEALGDGKILANWSPASGKSTAIRQYLCKNQMNYTIFATAKKSDVDAMYYDLIAMREAGYIVRECKITKFHSDYDPGESNLRTSNILICTHERLMIEPPSILYRLDGDIPNHLGQVLRNEMLIDELPKFYKSFKLSDTLLMGLGYVNNEVNRFKYDKAQRLSYRYSKFRSMAEAYFHDDLNYILPHEYGTVLGLIRTYQSNNITINDDNRERAVRKFAYFSDLLAEKLLESEAEEGLLNIINKNLYYTLLDIPVPNIKIFDGTGDLILRGSSYWETKSIKRFSRSILLRSYPQVLQDTNMLRSVSNSDDFNYASSKIDNLINHIRNILKNSSGKVLLYTWKSIKLQNDYYESDYDSQSKEMNHLPDYIRSKLSIEENDRLEIMYYGSGKERVTSEFSDCDSIIIAGKFFIPNSAISNYNEVNNTSITTMDYTKSLIIQGIYRTSARHNRQISIYFTSDYNNEMINNIMSEFDQILINSEDYTGYYKFSSQIHHTKRNYVQFKFLRSFFNELYLNGQVDDIVIPKPHGELSASYTRDYKCTIKKLLENSDIEFTDIRNTNRFSLTYKG